MCSLFKRVYLEPSQESTHYTAVWLFHPVSSNPLPLTSVPVHLLALKFTRFTLEIVTVVGFLSFFFLFFCCCFDKTCNGCFFFPNNQNAYKTAVPLCLGGKYCSMYLSLWPQTSFYFSSLNTYCRLGAFQTGILYFLCYVFNFWKCLISH